jgi:metal-responsive CopG/Arc/MetJ family transcriptional regulator
MARIPTAFSCDKEFLKRIDARAESLGMNRSQYIIQVLRKDLMEDSEGLNIVAESGTTSYGSKPKKK